MAVQDQESFCLCEFTHIQVVWGDIHQFLVTGVESLQQHSVSSFTVQTDPALWVTHWKWITECNEDKILQGIHTTLPSPSNNQTPLSQLQQMPFLQQCVSAKRYSDRQAIRPNIVWHWRMNVCSVPRGLAALSARPKLLPRQEWFMTSGFWAVFQYLYKKEHTVKSHWGIKM